MVAQSLYIERMGHLSALRTRGLRLLWVGLVALVPAAAHAGSIGIFGDPDGTVACADIAPGTFALLHVVAFRGDDGETLSGAEFRIEITQPDGWTISYIPPEGTVTVGNFIDRIPSERRDGTGGNLAFIVCPEWNAAGRIALGQLFVFNASGAPTELLVKRHANPPNRGFTCASFTSCDAPYYSQHCNETRLHATCATLASLPPGWSAGGECDTPYSVFGLNRAPDPKWSTPPPPRDVWREALAMLTRRDWIEFPDGALSGTLEQATVHSPGLRHVLQTFAIESAGRAMPCFDLADTVGVGRLGGVVRLTDWSKLWRFTAPHGTNMNAFIEALDQLPEVVFAERNGGSVGFDEAVSDEPALRVPNPLVGSGTIEVLVARSMPATVAIYDVRGRRVRRLFERTLSPGPNTSHWDGTDDAGRAVPPGIYLVRITAGSKSATQKLTFVR